MPSADSKKTYQILETIWTYIIYSSFALIIIICSDIMFQAIVVRWSSIIHKEECVFVVGSYGIHSLVYIGKYIWEINASYRCCYIIKLDTVAFVMA